MSGCHENLGPDNFPIEVLTWMLGSCKKVMVGCQKMGSGSQKFGIQISKFDGSGCRFLAKNGVSWKIVKKGPNDVKNLRFFRGHFLNSSMDILDGYPSCRKNGVRTSKNDIQGGVQKMKKTLPATIFLGWGVKKKWNFWNTKPKFWWGGSRKRQKSSKK